MISLSSLNPEQRSAVETIQGPVLILAGAGTGKTRVITFRIAHMVARSIPASHILGVTFTNKAARDMQERVRSLLPGSSRGSAADRPTLCTFHSLCVRILRQHIHRLGYKPGFVIYDESEQLSVIKKILAHISARGEKIEPAEILAALSRARNAGSPRSHDSPAAALARHIQPRYETALRACNAVDFDDLILLTQRLLDDHPDVLAACRAQYRYVMVDEYQDTNIAQFRLVHQLTREHRNLCVVGDDDQSIYGWRGAEIANLLNLEKHFPEVKVVKLEQNYRSTSTILAAANAVIRHNARRRGKNLWSQNGQGSRITLYTFATDDAEARTVVEQIQIARMARNVPWLDHAILFRTNQQSRVLETALRQAGVRYHLIGGQSFFDRREIKDFLAYLKVFVNPHDDISLLRIANVPARGLSDVTMERLISASQDRQCSVFSAMRHTDVQASFLESARKHLVGFLDLLDTTRAALTSLGTGPLSRWAEGFLSRTGYWDELRRSEKNPELAENRIRNLKDLLATLDTTSTPAENPGERLSTFLEQLALDQDRSDEAEREGDAVTLITIHSCKGLEFPHVFIVGAEDGLLPHSRSKEEGTMDEERRLFYVAITRAKQSLTISHCLSRKKYGQLLPCHPSPFLKELPEELVERGEERARKPVPAESGPNLFANMRALLGD